MFKFFNQNKVYYIIATAFIVILIYSIKLQIVLWTNPKIGYWDFKWYPYTNWREYWPLWFSIITMITCIITEIIRRK